MINIKTIKQGDYINVIRIYTNGYHNNSVVCLEICSGYITETDCKLYGKIKNPAYYCLFKNGVLQKNARPLWDEFYFHTNSSVILKVIHNNRVNIHISNIFDKLKLLTKFN